MPLTAIKCIQKREKILPTTKGRETIQGMTVIHKEVSREVAKEIER